MATKLTLDQVQFARASALGAATYELHKNSKGHYKNTPEKHIRGKVGEIACAEWLKALSLTVDEAFSDIARIREADMQIILGKPVRIEVKTWENTYWNEMGRCVAVQQLQGLSKRAEGIIWCASSPKLEAGIEVEILGWNTVADVTEAPQRYTGPKWRQVHNYQVDPEKVRSTSEFLGWLQDRQQQK